jgi:protein phosphatase
MSVIISGISDIGKKRSNNEDTFGICTLKKLQEQVQPINTDASDKVLAFVCDGMGGMEGGEIASAIAKDKIEEWFYKTNDPLQPPELLSAIETANEAILLEAEERPVYKGMGCTCSAIIHQDDGWIIAHIGDSRIYRWRNGKLEQITSDQTVLERLRREGKVPKNPHVRARFSHTLEQVLGSDKDLLKPKMIQGDSQTGDIYLICSDGLYEGLNLMDIQQIINRHVGRISLYKLNKIIIETSVDRSGSDNTTAVMMQIGTPEKQPYIKFVFQFAFHRIHKAATVVKSRMALIFTRKLKQFHRRFF